MIRKMSYRWHLHGLMADHELFQTSQLAPRLAERGIHLSLSRSTPARYPDAAAALARHARRSATSSAATRTT